MQPKTILIVDDEAAVRDSLQKVLSKAGYLTKTASSGNVAIEMFSKKPVDLVVSDLMMPDGDGFELLRNVKKKRPSTEVILLTGYGTIEKAVEAMKDGAYDFITKPFKKALILSTIERAVERQTLANENVYLRSQLSDSSHFRPIIGKSRALKEVMSMVERVAPLVSTVLITGASGTGKELIARALHLRSLRRAKRFVPINCAAIPENLLESELFGHMKGSFTGAIRDKVGLFKVADGGSIFLDEIVSVPMNLQVKLLRAIEEKEILPIGSTTPEIVDARIIAATNKNLGAEVEKGEFREDLYYRLNVVGITIPPLKERVEDIPELVQHFMKVYNAQLNKQINEVDDALMQALMDYEWKGNVRELENAIERAMILCDSNILTVREFPHLNAVAAKAHQTDRDLKASVRRFEMETILKALETTNYDKSRAADMLGLSLSSLYRKMSELGVELKR